MLKATTSFFAAGRVIVTGELVDDKDPVVAGREELFAPVEATPVIEEATAAPGVKRNTKRSVKKIAGE